VTEPESPDPRYAYVHVELPEAAVDSVSAELFARGAQGIEQRDRTTLSAPDGEGMPVTLVAHFEDETVAQTVARHFAERYASKVAFVEGDAWRDAWRAYFKPMRIGSRLVVRPSWETVKTWPDEVVLTLDPGRAFGSGTHETTRLVLREVDRRIRGGERVLDVGCGSGVLSVAALLLGASRVRAIDVDDAAVEVTNENARANDVASRLQASTTPVAKLRGHYDLVLANIEARVLIPMARGLSARLAPGATLVLSGILREQADEVLSAYPHLQHLITSFEGEWVAHVLCASKSRSGT
jgi:ribosomal protein L11 methyltransferase